MPKASQIVLFAEVAAGNDILAGRLKGDGIEVRAFADGSPDPDRPHAADLVIIDAGEQGDVPAAVRSCRRYWPDRTTPVLVLNVPDPHMAAAAIEAGATDSMPDASHKPLLAAHVRRMLDARATMRAVLDEERRRLRRESLARAAADVAVPLGELVDRIEAAMAAPPSDDLFDDLLDRVSRAVDAVDRLRRMAGSSPKKDDGDEGRA